MATLLLNSSSVILSLFQKRQFLSFEASQGFRILILRVSLYTLPTSTPGSPHTRSSLLSHTGLYLSTCLHWSPGLHWALIGYSLSKAHCLFRTKFKSLKLLVAPSGTHGPALAASPGSTFYCYLWEPDFWKLLSCAIPWSYIRSNNFHRTILCAWRTRTFDCHQNLTQSPSP